MITNYEEPVARGVFLISFNQLENFPGSGSLFVWRSVELGDFHLSTADTNGWEKAINNVNNVANTLIACTRNFVELNLPAGYIAGDILLVGPNRRVPRNV